MTGEPSAFRAGALGQPPKILLSVDGCRAQVAPWAGMPHPVRPSDEPAGPGRWWRRRRRRTPKPHPAPSPPPQPPPDPLTAWPWPLLYCADTGEAAGCAARAAQSGFRAIALQLGTYSQADVDACRAHGLRILGWGIAAPNDAERLASCGAEAYVPEIEGPSHRDAAAAQLESGTGARLLRGIVTTFSGLEQP